MRSTFALPCFGTESVKSKPHQRPGSNSGPLFFSQSGKRDVQCRPLSPMRDLKNLP